MQQIGHLTDKRQLVADVNLLAAFLAREEIPDLTHAGPVDCVVLCGSAILNCAEAIFAALAKNPTLAKTFVICGGIGHSTKYLVDAVRQHERYKVLADKIDGLPESRILYMIFEEFYSAKDVQKAGCNIIVEDRSTNCGANAIETKKELDAIAIVPRSLIIIQDPTMSIRTLASFEKAYEGHSVVPKFITYPSFVPRVSWSTDVMQYDIAGVKSEGIWDLPRFCDLLLGEIPRLRDDENGYGPKGKGFIAHVDVPSQVIEAWLRLQTVLQVQRANDLAA